MDCRGCKDLMNSLAIKNRIKKMSIPVMSVRILKITDFSREGMIGD